MSTTEAGWTVRALKLAVVLAGLFFAAVYLFVALSRIGYPYELEWMEGAHVDYVRRILAGRPIYIRPSIEFTPFIYTPLYFYVSALVAKITGFGLPGRGFFPLRLVSLLSSLGAFALVFLLVKREAGNWFASLTASGLLAATFHITGGYFDICRVDSLFLFVLLAAVYALRRARSALGFAAAGALFSLAFLTKQTGLIVSLPLMLWAAWAHRRRGLIFAATVVGLVAATTLIGDHLTGGWYRYYVFLLPRTHRVVDKMILGFWTGDIAARLFAPLVLAVVYFSLARGRGRESAAWFYLALLAGTLSGSWVSRLNEGGVENVLMPAYAGLAIVLGLGLDAAEKGLPRASEEARRLTAVLCLLCLAQFVWLWYPPGAHIPTQADRRGWDQVMEMAAGYPGEVYMSFHGYLLSLVGKQTTAHYAALRDVMIHDYGTVDDDLTAEIARAMKSRRFSAVVRDMGVRPPGFKGNYRLDRKISWPDDAGWPVAGRRTRPERIYVPLGPRREGD